MKKTYVDEPRSRGPMEESKQRWRLSPPFKHNNYGWHDGHELPLSCNAPPAAAPKYTRHHPPHTEILTEWRMGEQGIVDIEGYGTFQDNNHDVNISTAWRAGSTGAISFDGTDVPHRQPVEPSATWRQTEEAHFSAGSFSLGAGPRPAPNVSDGHWRAGDTSHLPLAGGERNRSQYGRVAVKDSDWRHGHDLHFATGGEFALGPAQPQRRAANTTTGNMHNPPGAPPVAGILAAG
jgi:hypothetical protein